MVALGVREVAWADGGVADRHGIGIPGGLNGLSGLVERLGTVFDQVATGGRAGVDLEPVRDIALDIAHEILPPWRHDCFVVWMRNVSELEIARCVKKSRATVRHALHDRVRRGVVEKGAISLVAERLRETLEGAPMAKPTKPSHVEIVSGWFAKSRPDEVEARALLMVLSVLADAKGTVQMTDAIQAFPRGALSNALRHLVHMGEVRSDGQTMRLLKFPTKEPAR